MDRNSQPIWIISSTNGQARKSLWIETDFVHFAPPGIVGQARKSLWIETYHLQLCGILGIGQARKSLWIET